jgi:hypothetical protein
MRRRTFVKATGAALVSAQAADLPLPREAMDLSEARFRVDLTSLLSPYDMVWNERLPGHWYEGAPLGNGDAGALFHGFPENLCITLSKSDVWDRRNDHESDFPGPDFRSFAKTYFDNDWNAYLRLQAEAARKRRRRTLALPHATSCGRITLHLDGGMQAAGCAMRVRLRDGVMELTYAGRTTIALMSRRHQVLLVDIDRGKPEAEPPDPVTTNRYGSLAPFEELPWEFWRPALEGNPRARCFSEGEFHFSTQRFHAGGEYSVGIAFSDSNDSETRTLSGRISGTLSGFTGRRCRMYVAVASSQDCGDTVLECGRRLRSALSAGPAAILTEHQQWWERYWMRGCASVGDKAIEKWYFRSLYLCGSALEPGRQSPGLQGVWVGENFPRWCADYHSNVNIQCLYWGMFANNRLDLLEPYLAHYHRTADAARGVARDYYKMRGLRYPHMGSIAGHEMSPPNMLGVDPGGTAWIVQLFWQFYLHTGDRKFLRDVAYPLIRDAALFYSDFMIRDQAADKWTMAPVVHFEARIYSLAEQPAHPPAFDMWGVNSLYAQAMFRMGFDQAIRAAAILGVDEHHRREWQDKLDNMAPPPATEDGRWKQWQNHEPVHGWHNFSLPLAFPAEQVSMWHGPRDWFDQARATWKQIKAAPKKTSTATNWCAQGLLELLRIGAIEDVFNGARWPASRPENGFTVDYGGALIQVDWTPAMNRVLAEMCVLSLDGVLHLFPGIPKHVPARFFSLRVPGGFLVTAEKRGDVPDYVLVRPTVDEVFRMEDPWTGKLITQSLLRDRTYAFARPGLDPALVPVTDFAINPSR